MAFPTDPLFSRQWYLTRTHVTDVWADYTGAGIHVGDFESGNGVDYNHYDLDANADPSRNFVYNGTTIDPTTWSNRKHGTSVAGVIAGERNGTGIVGVAYDAKFTVVPLQYVADYNGDGTRDPDPDYFGAAMAYQSAFDVTNNSWNMAPFRYGPDSEVWQNMKGAIGAAALTGRNKLGTVMVATPSNGRDGQQFGNGACDANVTGPLSNDRHVVVVGGVGSDDVVADYSGPGASLLVCAPAQGHWADTQLPGIWTTDQVGTAGFNTDTSANGGDFLEALGTSFAAPQVAGIVALILEANPNLGWRDVREILALTATHVGSAIQPTPSSPLSNTGAERHFWAINEAGNWNGGGMHFSNDYGFGMVDARAAVRLAETWDLKQTSLNEAHLSSVLSSGAAIPDRGTATFSFTVAEGLDIETVVLNLDLRHTAANNLAILLTSPSGTTSTLLRANTADTIDINGWEFTSNAFVGETSGGTWTLQVSDTVAGDIGSVGGGSLEIYGSRSSDDDTYYYTDEFGASGRIRNETDRGTLDDAVGHDTLSAAAVGSSVRIDLSGRTGSTIAGRALAITPGTIEDAVGGEAADTLIGGEEVNRLRGGRGNDTLQGGAGADILDGGLGTDTVRYADEAPESGVTVDLDAGTATDCYGNVDTLIGIENATGTDYLDVFIGNRFNNYFNGLGSEDRVSYANATSSVRVDLYRAGPQFISRGEGYDSFVSVESVTGSRWADTLRGNGADNTLDGGAGADTMTGEIGDDSYVVDNAGDVVNEAAGGGFDNLYARVSYTLAAGQEVEVLRADAGETAITLTGNELANTLVSGTAGDTLAGGKGNDYFVVNDQDVKAVEARDAGTDSVYASVSFSLVGQYIENLFLTGGRAIKGTGNSLANTLVGNEVTNTLDGGIGADILTGGGGSDSFAFRSALGSGVDRITDFSPAAAGNDDTILLSGTVFGMSQGALKDFTFKDLGVQGARLDASDRIVYDRSTGFLAYDADGSGSGAAVRFASLDNKAILTAADFKVV